MPWVVGKLSSSLMILLSVTLEGVWELGDSRWLKETNGTLVFPQEGQLGRGSQRSWRLASLRAVGLNCQETVSKHVDGEVVVSSLHGFMKGSTCPAQSNYLRCWDDGLHWQGRICLSWLQQGCRYSWVRKVQFEHVELSRYSFSRLCCPAAVSYQQFPRGLLPGSALSLFTTWTVFRRDRKH